ncbi:hypothetical protein TcCL_NonESM11120 [Trypanosoma cruzi]|nr:hypothetical protein TcCL_NonESM11120 [Trypanosoma cruzi]
MPSAMASPCCQRPVRNSLVPSRSQACDAPRHDGATSLSSGIGCTAVLLGPRLCSASAVTSSRREHRHSLPSSKRLIDVLLPNLRLTGTRPADHKQPIISVVLPFLTLKRQDRPDLLRNLHLACPRHLLVERRAADQRRPAQAAAASSRPSTIWRHTPDALTPALQSLQKASHVDSATAPRSSQQVPHAQVITENVKRINEQKTDNAPLQAPMTAVALQPLLCCNPHQPLSPRQSTGRPAAHAVGMPPSSTTEHPTIWENTLSHDSTVQEGKTGHIATDSPRAINEQWQQSITKQIHPFSQHRKTSPSHSQLPQ